MLGHWADNNRDKAVKDILFPGVVSVSLQLEGAVWTHEVETELLRFRLLLGITLHFRNTFHLLQIYAPACGTGSPLFTPIPPSIPPPPCLSHPLGVGSSADL